jgi:deoxyribonuclease-4
VVAHAAYLINLAATDPAILEKSRLALADELGRAATLGLDGVVVHPGAHLGVGIEAGLDAVARSLDELLRDLPAEGTPPVLLELTAGQGTVLGHTLEQLAAIRERCEQKQRIAYCLDSCHAFAAGYDLGSAEAVERFVAETGRTLGLDLVTCIHLNDSVGALGSRKDRHANLGEGEIGLDGFRRLLAEAAFADVPMVLETPIGEDELGHARDLETLRGLSSG